MAVKLAPVPRQQYVDSSGNPYSGAKLFYYAAGTTTKQNTYTTSTGGSTNTNPIVLDSSGRTPYGVWLTEGVNYKAVLAPANDTDPPTSPIFTEDVFTGINDNSDATNQWAASGVTPTYVSATQFTVTGDKTSTFLVDRRVKCTVTAGTVYGYISVSAYTTLTTVTVVLDSGSLDSGLSAVQVGILTDLLSSIPLTITRNTATQTLTNKTINGGTHTAITSFGIRSTGAAFDLTVASTEVLTAGRTLTIKLNDAARTIDIAGALTLAAAFTTSGANALTLTTTGATNVTLPTTGTLAVTTQATDTFGALTDVTTNNVSATAHGFCPKFPNNTTTFLRGDGTYASAGAAATQAEMEAASSNTVFATPLNANWHPGVAKAWVVAGVTANILASHNITSLTDTGTGELTVTIATDFSSANYVINVTGSFSSGQGYETIIRSGVKAAGSFQVDIYDGADGVTARDPVNWHIVCFGDQA